MPLCFPLNGFVCLAGCLDVLYRKFFWEPVIECIFQCGELNFTRCGGKCTHERRIGNGQSQCPERDRSCIYGDQLYTIRYFIIGCLFSIHDYNTSLFHTLEHIHIFDQRAVLDNDIIRFIDLAPLPDNFIIEPDKCLDGCPPPLDTKSREGLGKGTTLECGDSNQFSSGDRSLPPAAVYA